MSLPHPHLARTTLIAGLLALPLLLAGAPRVAEAGAPPANWTYEDKVHKFSLKMLRDYEQVPLKVDEETVVCRFRDPKSKGQARGTFDVSIEVVRVAKRDEGPVVTGDISTPTDIERIRERLMGRLEPKNVWEATVGRLRVKPDAPSANQGHQDFKDIKSKDKPAIPGRYYELELPMMSWRGETELLYAALAIFEKDDVEMGIFMYCGERMARSYKSRFKQIAKSFTWFDEDIEDVDSLDVLDGVNITAKKRLQIERSLVEGWGVVVSPKKNYIVLYNTKQGRNHQLAKVIAQRIELIREQIYEVQFPPAQPIETVCICRVCGDRKEYHAYGGPGGSAGYWSPGDEELVFYDASPSRKIDDDTVSVLYHEAFHQYIYYSVGNVAPHSWFNEGHGDYYAGAELRGKKFEIKPFRWRLGTIKNAIVQGPRPFTMDKHRKVWEPKGYTPLEDLVRFSQRDYYSYPGVSYAQGWSLIYFLREIVPKNKKYREKWGHILDTYFDVLKAEVNRSGRVRPFGVRGEEDDDDGESDEGEGDEAPPPPVTPGGEPAPEDEGPAAPGGAPSGEGDDTGGDEGDEGPPDPGFGPMQVGGYGPQAALEKAVAQAFQGVDWEEFTEAWIKGTKRGK